MLALDRDNTTILDTGILAVIDNQIDVTTGTIKLKATFPNTNLVVFGPANSSTRASWWTKSTAWLFPKASSKRYPDGPYVFTVHGDGSNRLAKLTPVMRCRKLQDNWALVSKGLSDGETVVVDGQYRLEDGSKVRVEDGLLACQFIP